MSDEYIRDILAGYSDFCMDTFYSPNREELEKHVFSRRREKKMKKLSGAKNILESTFGQDMW